MLPLTLNCNLYLKPTKVYTWYLDHIGTPVLRWLIVRLLEHVVVEYAMHFIAIKCNRGIPCVSYIDLFRILPCHDIGYKCLRDSSLRNRQLQHDWWTCEQLLHHLD